MSGHGLAGVADAGAFLARLVRLDRAAVVRLRSAGERTTLWARLPWQVLVTRTVSGPGPGDVTVAASELLAELSAGSSTLPARRDEDWRWPLPPTTFEVLEVVGVAEVAALAAAAAETVREAAEVGVGGRAIGQRALRDALLDHVALTVRPSAGGPVPVSQRLVQAVARMGFLGSGDDTVARVCGTETWTGISAPYGVAWMHKATTLTLVPVKNHPFG